MIRGITRGCVYMAIAAYVFTIWILVIYAGGYLAWDLTWIYGGFSLALLLVLLPVIFLGNLYARWQSPRSLSARMRRDADYLAYNGCAFPEERHHGEEPVL